MNNIDNLIMNANQAATQASQQPVTIDQNTSQQQAQYIPQQQQQTYQQPVQQQQQTHQQPVQQQQQYQQQPVQQQQYQQQPVQQQQYQQQPVQQQQYQQVMPQQQQQMAMVPQQQVPAGQLPAHLMQMMANPMQMSMENFMAMGLAVDVWVKPDYTGMTVGDDTTPVEFLDVEIDMAENVGFVLVMAIRYGANPVKYNFTKDFVTDKDGQPWNNALMAAYSIDPSVNPYRAVQIPMTVLAEAKNLKGTVVAEAGSRMGYTTSVTGWSAWLDFYQQVVKAGLLNQRVAVRLTNVPKVKNNNKWGIITFKLLGAVQAAPAAQGNVA